MYSHSNTKEHLLIYTYTYGHGLYLNWRLECLPQLLALCLPADTCIFHEDLIYPYMRNENIHTQIYICLYM